MSQPIHVYASAQDAGFARVLAENLSEPVQVHPLAALPRPDTQRPTRQQLRKELAEVQHALKECKKLIALMEPHAQQLGAELAELTAQRQAGELREEQIFFTLGIPGKGGPAPG
jgi:hypothetical protein